MNVDQFIATFVTESRELLQEMENALLACERAGADAESINAIFRAAHTIKGGAGMFSLEHIVHFTHALETCLDQARTGRLLLTAPLITLLLECCDHITAQIERCAAGEGNDSPEQAQRGELLVERLQSLSGLTLATTEARASAAGPVVPTAAASGASGFPDAWHISVRFGAEVLRNGMDPIAFIRYLTTFGELVAVEIVGDALPPLAEFDPEVCYLGFELDLCTTADQARIESAFDFVRSDCQLSVSPPFGSAPLAAPAEQASAPAVAAGVACPEKAGAQPRHVETNTIRVDAAKLDRLIDLIGELIVTGAATELGARKARLAELTESASRLARLVEEVRDSALELRMVQIGGTFNRFQRVVREVSAQLGKQVALQISGSETELDKTMVERISDPLLHLVRNAIDHGIERPDVRTTRGKSAQGTLSLRARHDSGSVVIEVSDDGAGIDRERVRRKAVERGLLAADAAPGEREVLNLIFAPGFSTAAAVTDVSGRGVGMDVVKRNIEQMRGSVELESMAGQGSTVRIRLPLTLAIIDGFLLRVGGASYVLPLDIVEECVELPRTGTLGDADYLDLRGAVLPMIRLRNRFAIEGPVPRRQNVVVIRWGARRVGLVVDALLGKLQAVIKPLPRVLSALEGVTGSTILGDGTVALILDIGALAFQAELQARAIRSNLQEYSR